MLLLRRASYSFPLPRGRFFPPPSSSSSSSSSSFLTSASASQNTKTRQQGPQHHLLSPKHHDKHTLAFIGLGQMGARMAANLLAKKPPTTPLLIYDTNPAAMAALKAKGATPALSLDELTAKATIIMTMLPATSHVQTVLGQIIIPQAQQGTLLIDSSTIDPTASKALSQQAATRGLAMVDAPVSGGVGGAEAGTLTFMVGASLTEHLEKAKEMMLQHMGKNIVHCGGPGTGSAAKVCNNLVLGVNMLGVAEAMSLGVKLGIDPSTLNSVLNTSSGRSWVTELYNPCPGVVPAAPASKGYQGGFAARLMQKDLSIAEEAAKAVGAPLPVGALVHQLYALVAAQGKGGKDFSCVYEFLRGVGEGEGGKGNGAGGGAAPQ